MQQTKSYRQRILIIAEIVRRLRNPTIREICGALALGSHEYAETTVREDIDFLIELQKIEAVAEKRYSDGKVVIRYRSIF